MDANREHVAQSLLLQQLLQEEQAICSCCEKGDLLQLLVKTLTLLLPGRCALAGPCRRGCHGGAAGDGLGGLHAAVDRCWVMNVLCWLRHAEASRRHCQTPLQSKLLQSSRWYFSISMRLACANILHQVLCSLDGQIC